MTIKLASEFTFSPAPRCPECDVGLLAYGRSEPIAVDERGRPYCRLHGAPIDPGYAAALEAYRTARIARRANAIARLEAEDAPASSRGVVGK